MIFSKRQPWVGRARAVSVVSCFFFAQAREEEGIERKRVLFLLKLSPMSLGMPHLWGYVVLVFSLRGVVAAAIKCGG